MKKYCLFVCVLLISVCATDSWATKMKGKCNSPITVNYEGNQEPDDNEFLYENDHEYQLTKQGYENSGHKNSGSGKAYECDKFRSGSCGTGAVVTMPAGHYFKGKKVNKKQKYQCKTAFDDYWVAVDDGNVCSTNGFGDVAIGDCVKNGSQCKKLTDIDCSGYELSDPVGTAFEGWCFKGPKFQCVAIECRQPMVAKNGKCVADNTPNPQDTDKTACEESGGTWANNACTCDATKNLKQSADKKTCVCTDSTYKYNKNTKRCDKKGTTPVTPDPVTPITPAPEQFECPPDQLAEWRIKKTTYQNDAEIIAIIEEIELYCRAPNDDGARWYELIVRLENMIKEQSKSIALLEIQQIISDLNGLKEGASVWRDADGKFNTARLASDLTAGVVLGTASGLITAAVVKKTQIKKGFEDLQCTVGGQKVADWGDEFNVGISY